MITYLEHTLPGGLTVVAHRAAATQMAAVNIAYRVGARNENPKHTGFAHLFEHLMFRGTRAVPDFDAPLHKACAENNAFTNNDYTDYFITLPRENVSTALWLEADRLGGLDITPSKLQAEKKVVIEEFNQSQLNQPYGDMWPLVLEMAYTVHPYRWSTIGIEPDHIRNATLTEVKAFHKRYYTPSNAILSMAADLDPEAMVRMAEEWFGAIPGGSRAVDNLPAEPPQTEARRVEVTRDVPATVVTVVFHMGARTSRSYYACNILSDILSGGASSRLYERLTRRRKLFSSVDAYLTGSIDPGLFAVTGHLLPEVSVDVAEEALWDELRELCETPVSEIELEKVRNKFEAETLFGELNVMNKAMNLGYYALLGDLPLINREVDIYRSVEADELRTQAQATFRREGSSTLVYRAKK